MSTSFPRIFSKAAHITIFFPPQQGLQQTWFAAKAYLRSGKSIVKTFIRTNHSSVQALSTYIKVNMQIQLLQQITMTFTSIGFENLEETTWSELAGPSNTVIQLTEN